MAKFTIYGQAMEPLDTFTGVTAFRTVQAVNGQWAAFTPVTTETAVPLELCNCFGWTVAIGQVITAVENGCESIRVAG